MRFKYPALVGGIAAVTAGLFVLTASPALAVVPSNDAFGGAATISALPFNASLDTVDATTDADDTSANTTCGAPATDASVWYSFAPAADIGVVVDVSASTFTAGVIVVTGAPGSFALVTCGPDTVGFFAAGGTTYYLLLFDDQIDGTGNGGLLNVTVDQAPPPPTIDATVNPTASFDSKTGSATLSGTVTCSGQALFSFLDIQLSQRVGRVATIRGFTSIEVLCDGASHDWSATVLPESGQFKGGKGASVTFAVACGVFECSVDFEERQVQLSRR